MFREQRRASTFSCPELQVRNPSGPDMPERRSRCRSGRRLRMGFRGLDLPLSGLWTARLCPRL